MIKEVEGDILLSKAQGIAHGIAPGDHFQQGLALALRERWPALAKDFRHYCHAKSPKPGSAWVWGAASGERVICLMTQTESPGGHAKPGPAKLEHVNHALRELRRIATEEKLKSLALPKLATGVGGLEWKDVRPLIDQHLGDLGIPVYLYATYHPKQPAAE